MYVYLTKFSNKILTEKKIFVAISVCVRIEKIVQYILQMYIFQILLINIPDGYKDISFFTRLVFNLTRNLI